ncbi:MAG: hypothetical protein JWM80_933 [Cyanobacteria bacterium RYN_339]|nr:hypothetical protein [Cyanobacteria bacterium RYN_339]
MHFVDRPTKFQALARTLAIMACVATLGLWGLVAFGWDMGSLYRYGAGKASPSGAVHAVR